jgi:hypothetical protein
VIDDPALGARLAAAAHAHAVEHLSWGAATASIAAALSSLGFDPAA